jgi:hypothetical protein
VDGDGVPVACSVTASNVNETLAFERLFLAAFAVAARIRTVFADKSYDAERHRRRAADPQARPSTRIGSGRAALDRLGFVVQSLLRAACIFLVARRLARGF